MSARVKPYKYSNIWFPPKTISSKLVNLSGQTYNKSNTGFSLIRAKSVEATNPVIINKSRGQILVDGILYQVTKKGNTLQKITNDNSTKKSKTLYGSNITINGATYTRTPNGLIKQKINLTRATANRIIQQTFKRNLTAKKQYCIFFTKYGKCNNEGKCPYNHDRSKVAVCRKFLKGMCNKPNCLLSHKVAQHQMPVCYFFLRGTCHNENCFYSHVKVSAEAAVCDAFLKGYCPDGQNCKLLHTDECQEFKITGKCPNGDKCKLKHVNTKKRKKKQKKTQKNKKLSNNR